MKKLLLSALLLAGAAAAQTPPSSLQATVYSNITSASTLDAGGVIDNRSQFTRRNSYHAYRAFGTGTWSVDMQFADGNLTNWTSYGNTAQVTNVSPSSGIGFGIDQASVTKGYHDYIRFVFTGSVTIQNYFGTKQAWFLPTVGAISYPLTANQGGTNATTTAGWASMLGYLVAATGGVERTAQSKLGEVLSVKDFGATGDGTTDDTVAVTAAITAACAAHVRLRIPAGTYIVGAPSTAQILPMCSNLAIDGDGWGVSVLKVKAASGSYDTVFGPKFAVITHVTLQNFTIDQNSANNTAPSGADLTSHPRFIISTATPGSGLVVNQMEVLGIQSINTIYCGTVGSQITNNRFVIYGGGTAYHDHSTLYMAAEGAVVSNNTFVGTVNGSGSVAAVETHGGDQTVTGNAITGYLVGMNITGVALTESAGITVTGNVIKNAYYGIQLWSYIYQTHTTGYGLHNVVVSGNSLGITQNGWTTQPSGTGLPPIGNAFGIQLNVHNSLSVKGVLVTGNIVEFDQSVSSGEPFQNSGFGIGYWDADDSTSTRFEQLSIINNTIVNAQANAIRVSAVGTDLVVSGNRITNPGNSLNRTSAGAPAFFSGIFLSAAAAVSGWRVNGNVITDNLATTRMEGGLAQLITAAPADVVYSGNTFSVTGDAAVFVKSHLLFDNTQLPMLADKVNAPNAASYLPAVGAGIGSTIDDLVTGKRYTAQPFSRWVAESFGTVQPSGAVVSGATNANPIVITALGSFATGTSVTISGVTGNTAANGTWTVTYIGGLTFSLNGSTGNGSYVSGGLATDYTVARTAIYGDVVTNSFPFAYNGIWITGWMCIIPGTPGTWQPVTSPVQAINTTTGIANLGLNLPFLGLNGALFVPPAASFTYGRPLKVSGGEIVTSGLIDLGNPTLDVTGVTQVGNGGTGSAAPAGWTSNLNYLSTATGGFSRTAQAKFGDAISVMDIGAKCDGTTDDTVALQNAINSLSPGRTLLFPRSATACMISAGLQISGMSNIAIQGEHHAEIKYIAGTTDVLYNSWPNFGKDSIFRILGSSNVRISGLKLNGNISNRTAFGGQESQNSNILIANLSNNITIEGNELTEGMTDGVAVNYDSSHATINFNVFIRNNFILNSRRNNISVTGAHQTQITGNVIQGAGSIQGTAPEAGIDVEADTGTTGNIDDALIQGNTVINNLQVGIRQFGPSVTNLRIANNYVGSNSTFGIATEITTGTSQNVSVTGNQVANNTLTGIRVRKASADLVANNNVFSNSVGISGLEAVNLLISGNTIHNNVTDGIELGSQTFSLNFTSAMVVSNLIYDNANAASLASNLGWALNAFSTSTATNLAFTGNTLYNTAAVAGADLMGGAFRHGSAYISSNIGNSSNNINATNPVYFGGFTNQITNPITFLDPAGATNVTVQAGTAQGANPLQTWKYSNGNPGIGFLALSGGFLSENIYRVSDGAVMGQLSYAGASGAGFQNFGLNNVAGDYLSLNSTNGPVKISTGSGSVISINVDAAHHTQIASAGTYANNAAAIAAGLPTGTIYLITGTDTPGIVH